MSTVQSYTAAHIDAITNPLIQSGVINSSGHLVLTTRDGTVIDLGPTVSDADLAAIGALTPADNDMIQRKSGVWTNRTLAQVQLDMGFNAPSPVNNDFMQRKSGQWVNRTIAQVMTDLITDPHLPQVAIKTATTTRTATTVLDDPDLHLNLDPNSTYDVTFDMSYGGAVGLVFGWTVPSGVTGFRCETYNLSGTGTGVYTYVWTAANQTAGIATPGMKMGGYLTTAAAGGNFAFHWGSATSGQTSQVGTAILRARKISP